MTTRIFQDKYPFIFIIGKKRYGKTSLALWLIENSNLSISENIYIVSPTAGDQEKTFRKFKTRMSDKNIVILPGVSGVDFCKLPKNTTLLLDDTGAFTKSNFNKLVLRQAHHQIRILFLGHYTKHIPPDLRGNVDVLISFRVPNDTEFKQLFSDYIAGCFAYNGGENDAIEILRNLRKYEFMIVDTNNSTYSTGILRAR